MAFSTYGATRVVRVPHSCNLGNDIAHFSNGIDKSSSAELSEAINAVKILSRSMSNLHIR